MSHPDQNNRGFKLIQLVIVVGIIGIVSRLLLPAVRNLRGAAGRMRCQSRLKQMGLALHNFSEMHPRGEFPSGCINLPDFNPEERLSWMVAILPMWEQDEIYRRIDLKKDVTSNHDAIQKKLTIYHCQFDRDHADRRTDAHTDYVAMAGIGGDAAVRPANSPGIGFMGFDRVTTFKDITDGTSNTIAVMETSIMNGSWARGGQSTLRPFVMTDQSFHGTSRPFGGRHLDRGWFRHTDLGTNVLFADGSVRTISPAKTDSQWLAALITIAGDEPVVDW